MPKLRKTVPLLTALVLVIIARLGPAQSDRGTITGLVTDQSGAAMAGVSVTATHVATGIKSTTSTAADGNYTLPLLRVGTYEIAAEVTGFKLAKQQGVVVEVGQTVNVPIHMQVGSVTQTVEVNAHPGQIEKDTSERGTVVNGRDVLELPIVGQGEQRNPGYFMILSPGVTGRGVSYGGSPRMLNTTVNGSQSASNEFQLDGALIGSPSEWAGDFRNIPFPQDAVGEFKVLTLNPPAEYGRTGQGITSFTLRSGTNRVHGSAYEFLRNNALDSRGFFATKTPINKQNEFGATVGGPVWIPKLYNGKDKTFFFGWYQGFRLRKGSNNFTETVPTDAMRAGDLSSILGPQISTCGESGDQPCVDALARPVYEGEVYDPATSRTVNGVEVRDPFPGNIIPADRIDSVAKSILSYFPEPSRQGVGIGGFRQNFLSTALSQQSTNEWGSKVDHAISEKNRISGEFIWLKNYNPAGSYYPGAISGGGISYTQQDIARFSQDYNLAPNLLNHWTVGYNRWRSDSISDAGTGWPAKIGWKGVPQTGPGSVFPGFNIAGLGDTYGNGGQGYDAFNTFTFDESLTWLKGKHTIKTGFSYVKMQSNDGGFGRQSGYLTFNCGETALPGFYQDSCSAGAESTGFGLSSFLLGLGTTGEADVYAAVNADRMGQYAWYGQDDFKVTPRLTLNYGFRYDLLLPTVSAHNQMSWMDPTAPNPAIGGFPGAEVFATSGRRSGASTYTKAFGPRFGLAYALNDKTVIRGGYAILYTLGGAERSNRGCCFLGGFNSKNFLPIVNQGIDPAFVLQDGWPASQFPNPPFINPAYGLNGTVYPVYPGDGRPPDIQNWSISVQRQLPGQILIDAAYVGTGGRHLVSRLMPTNAMPDQYLSFGSMLFTSIADPTVQALPVIQAMPVDPATGNHAPFAGFQSIAGSGATLGQALRPFPQYQQDSLSQLRRWTEGVGVSSYNALQLQARKTFSQGLSFLVSYTWSKTLTDADSIFGEFSGFAQDYYNRKAEKSYALNDYPSNLVLSYEYQLPFGPGKRFANVGGAAGKIVGGWSVSGIQQYQSGPPQLVFYGSNSMWPYDGPNSFMLRPNVVPGVPQKSAAIMNGTYDPNASGDQGTRFNIKAFTPPAPFTYGTGPRMYSQIRRQAYLNEDISLLKRTQISESVNVEFRADFLNIFNRTVLGFDQGGDQYGSALQGGNMADPVGFGRVGSQGNYPREIQFGIKINY